MTVSNGSAIFDSDFLDNGNQANPANPNSAAFGAGTAPARHQGELISPKIDLSTSGITSNTPLAVELHHKTRKYSSNCSVSLSTDNGVNWTTGQNYDQLISNDSRGSIPFPGVLQNVSDFSQIRIKLSFEGDYYYSIVDDISLSIVPDYDLRIANMNADGNTLADAMTIARVSNNRYTPKDMLALQEFIFGAKVLNYGAKDVRPSNQGGPKTTLYLNINYLGGENPASSSVYQDSLVIQDILPAYASSYSYDYKPLNDLNFIQTYGKGDYEVVYSLANDSFAVNSSKGHLFSISDHILSKVPVDGNNLPYSNTAVLPGGNSQVSFEYGSMFYFPSNPHISPRKIKQIHYACSAGNTYVGPSNYNLFNYIYEWVDSDNDNVIDADGTELSTAFIGVDANIPVTPGMNVQRSIDSFFDANLQPITTPALKENTFYWITLDQTASNNSLSYIVGSNGELNCLYINAFDTYSYAINLAAGLDSPAIALPSPIRTASGSITASPSINNVGLGADLLPAMSIELLAPILSTNSLSSSSNASLELILSPNPVQDQLNLSYVSDEKDMNQIIITDVNGRVHLLDQVHNESAIRKSYNLANWPQGLYYLTVRSSSSRTTKSFVKQQ